MRHEYSRSRMAGTNLLPLIVKRNSDRGPKAGYGDSPVFLFFPQHTCKNLNSRLCRHVRRSTCNVAVFQSPFRSPWTSPR